MLPDATTPAVRSGSMTDGFRERQRCWRYLLEQRLAGRYVFIHINKCGGTSVEAALGIPKLHDTARLRRLKIGRRRWEKAFTFALVRHPYSRLISFYKYRARYNQTGLRDERPLDLNAWIRATLADRDPAYYDQPRMFAPCFDWVSDRNGRVIVDYIAKLETIEEQWPVIQERIGEPGALPVRNVSGNRSDREILDGEARRIIQESFRKDFEAFGYEP